MNRLSVVSAKQTLEHFARDLKDPAKRRQTIHNVLIVIAGTCLLHSFPVIIIFLLLTIFPGLRFYQQLNELKAHTDKVVNARFRMLSLVSVAIFLALACFEFVADWCTGMPRDFLAYIGASTLVLLAATFLCFLGRKLIMHARLLPNLARSLWFEGTYASLLLIMAGILSLAIWMPDSVGDWMASWLVSSARDANLFASAQAEARPAGWDFLVFANCVKAVLTLVGFLAFSRPFTLAAGALTTIADRLAHCTHRSRWWEATIDTLRMQSKTIFLHPKNACLRNIALSFWWLLACYAVLFLLIGTAPGALGVSISNWLFASVQDAGITLPAEHHGRMQWFMAAIFAMYATAPVAISACVFLPRMRPRELKLNHDGLLYAPCLSMLFRPLRLWTDVGKVQLNPARANVPMEKRSLVISFRTGGFLRLRLSDMTRAEVADLLGTLDERANLATIYPEVIALRIDLSRDSDNQSDTNKQKTNNSKKFKSTIFVPLSVGQTIESKNIRVVRLLASKPLSAVYLVRLQSGRLGVLKQLVLPSMTQEADKLKESFKREYELLNRLDNPHISKVLDAFEIDESNFLLLEHNRGQDLQSLVEHHGARRETTVLNWAKQIAQIMRYLHSTNDPPIVHRDLTPDNLIIDDDDKLRLIDFGAAHQFLEGVTGTLIGKQCYVAPEQLRGKATVRSDIYSFGATLYFLLTGREPSALSQCDVRMHEHTVSEAMVDLIKRCTEFDEEKRPGSFEDVLAMLDAKDFLPARLVDEILQSEAMAQKINAATSQEKASNDQLDARSPAPEAVPLDQADMHIDASNRAGQSIHVDENAPIDGKINLEMPLAVKVERP